MFGVLLLLQHGQFLLATEAVLSAPTVLKTAGLPELAEALQEAGLGFGEELEFVLVLA